jgi:hypothetical protein
MQAGVLNTFSAGILMACSELYPSNDEYFFKLKMLFVCYIE